VWVKHGCGSCHTFAPAGADGDIGPDLAETLRGKPDEYILEGIIAPTAAAPAGYRGASIMPDDFAERIPRADLDRLVAFIRSGVR
jgi:mono/diheme cytochrome c family protein